MKKQYVKPTAEFVNMKLFGSVLEEVVVVGGSNGIIDADSKENTGLWDDVDDEEPWSSVTESSNDLWGSDENEDE